MVTAFVVGADRKTPVRPAAVAFVASAQQWDVAVAPVTVTDSLATAVVVNAVKIGVFMPIFGSGTTVEEVLSSSPTDAKPWKFENPT